VMVNLPHPAKAGFDESKHATASALPIMVD
jgi:hypothetical protein